MTKAGTIGFRVPSRASLSKTVLAFMLLLMPAWSQPLHQGAQTSAGRFFLDESKLLLLDQKGQLKKLPEGLGDKNRIYERLYQPTDKWENAFVAVAPDLVLVVKDDTATPLWPQLEVDEKEKKPVRDVVPWGDALVVRQNDSIKLVSPTGEVEGYDTDGIIYGPYALDSQRLCLVLKNGTYVVFTGQSLESPEPQPYPFSSQDVQATPSADRLLLWSKKSKEFLLVDESAMAPLTTNPRDALGLKNGGFVLNHGLWFEFLTPGRGRRQFRSPVVFNEKMKLADASFFEDQGILHTLFSYEDQGIFNMGFRLSGETSGGNLGKEEIQTVLTAASQDSHLTFLVTETVLNEVMVDRHGNVVKNLETGEDSTYKVKGHAIYLLNQMNTWQNVVIEPRSRLVGPVQIVRDRLIYATQTEPPNRPGESREFNHRYPYPKVVIHAVNASTGRPAWTLDLPRGEAPAAARLPDDEWPLLAKDGPVLFTTEDNRLSALDPVSGEVQWTSESLPLDDSRPAMIRWDNSLGLVATNRTTRNLLLFGLNGQLQKKVMLNELFNSQRTLNLIGVVVICLALIVYIYLAGKKKLFIRRIAGLEALDEAVGRATEMGKPVLYVTGLADVDDIQTLAALSILSHVAKKTAEYDTSILATTSRAVTFSAAQEVVRDAFTIAGRPEAFSLESVRYISDDQFGYAAGVDGLMVREEPAANFYMGKFYAESLIFAETGYATGAIQIAGTAQANQLPFFVAACDYTLIGEELFAASAYLSGDPLQVGSLRGQDVGKAIVMITLVLVSLDVTYASITGGPPLLHNLYEFIGVKFS